MLTAVVTGASRGVGRGVAKSLAQQGFRVFATGRTIDAADLPASVFRARCNHLNDDETAEVFGRVAAECDSLGLLVNCAWGGYERMSENGQFTWPAPFWEQPSHRWTNMMDAGVRAAFVASSHAARFMVRQREGLIVNISFWAAKKHIGNTIYGISKAATDKMTADMAHELRPYGVPVISYYPGLVRTEAVMEAAAAGWLDVSNSESPEFAGLVIAALMRDPGLMDLSGTIVVGAAVARELGVSDIDGRRPEPLALDRL
ncbi:MAG TPA: SDR family NAD(P)-dependent oxidoreductase [Bryobacteraceae bacterium]|nr:SDR family NAD(P)-dependent oxidoreductase [Bryobacteraceae bacterium]